MSPLRRNGMIAGGVLALPCFAALSVLFIFPIVTLLGYSLHPYDGPAQVGPEFTLANFRTIMTDDLTAKIMIKTLGLGFAVLALDLVLAYPVAYFLARTQSRLRGFYIFLAISPLLISAVVRNLGWFPILASNGFVNWLLTAIVGSTPVPLINTFLAVTLALAHALLPLMILTLFTVIQRIDPEIERAAVSLGAHPFMAFMRVVFPLTRPGLIGGGMLVFAIAIAAFTTPAFMGGNKVVVMAIHIAQLVRSTLDYAMGAAAAVVLVVTSAVIAVAALSWQRVGGEAR